MKINNINFQLKEFPEDARLQRANSAKLFYLEWFKEVLEEIKTNQANEIIMDAATAEDLAFLRGSLQAVSAIEEWFEEQVNSLIKDNI